MKQILIGKKTPFIPRVPELLAIEGWYVVDGVHVKISCRFKDILRCSRTKHFISCFNNLGCFNFQPYRRCADDTWAIIYTPDKHGDFMGRAFINYIGDNCVNVDKIYGNRLTNGIIREIFINIINKMDIIRLECQFSEIDTYLCR